MELPELGGAPRVPTLIVFARASHGKVWTAMCHCCFKFCACIPDCISMSLIIYSMRNKHSLSQMRKNYLLLVA
jgi:hypothetical protein